MKSIKISVHKIKTNIIKLVFMINESICISNIRRKIKLKRFDEKFVEIACKGSSFYSLSFDFDR